MKKIYLFVTIITSCSILNTSCNNKEECDVLIDPAKVPVSIIVKDSKGINLLDPKFDGNILETDIEVIYRGEKYPLILSEYDISQNLGLHTGLIDKDNTPGILFWYFYVGRDRGGDEFTINWGDGTSDKVSFDFYYTVVKCEPVSHRKIYLNGTLQSEDSLTVTIIK